LATKSDTLYFNAFTEDLFHWDNDLENDMTRVLQAIARKKDHTKIFSSPRDIFISSTFSLFPSFVISREKLTFLTKNGEDYKLE
jgi:hypothetical protein